MAVLDVAGVSDAQVEPTHEPSQSQLEAIRAPLGPALVLAGPGSGKTFCLIERIRFLIENGVEAKRICAFTFTNKAADEIAQRLERLLGQRAEGVRRGTIHAFCAELLREYGSHVGLERGFGIADEEYQLEVLRRIEGARRYHKSLLGHFSRHRLGGHELQPNDEALFAKYEKYLGQQKVVDFDTLVIKAAELLETVPAAAALRGRWSEYLVDEFQDLSSAQYRVIHALSREHDHVFAVGDDEQSIYAFAGADPRVFWRFTNEFAIKTRNRIIYLQENRRCPREIFSLARRLIASNPSLFTDREPQVANKSTPHEVQTLAFKTHDEEAQWIVDDIRRDQEANGHQWGEVALLYRKHTIGNVLEASLINARIKCRLARGRALADERVVAYLVAALRVIGNPKDDVERDKFLAASLPRSLIDQARERARKHSLYRYLNYLGSHLPRGDARGRAIRRALARYGNLAGLAQVHRQLEPLVRELLSQRVTAAHSALEKRHDDISDPAGHEEVVRLAHRLKTSRSQRRPIALPRLGGAEVALEGMLATLGFSVRRDDATGSEAEHLQTSDTPTLGLALGLFKALQLLEIDSGFDALREFTVIDFETTSKDPSRAEIIDIGAVRVRDGQLLGEYGTLVRPRSEIPLSASEVHGIHNEDVANERSFREVWPEFRAFCGDLTLVAHNGYHFDFRVLERAVREDDPAYEIEGSFDTLLLARDLVRTSCKLVELAHGFGIDPGRSHRALDDARTLAKVFLKLKEAQAARARKTALVNLLDQLGIALALSDEASLCEEAKLFRDFSGVYALGRYSTALDYYEREAADDETVASVNDVIDALGGYDRMLRIRAEKTAEQLYPNIMVRLQRLLGNIPDGPLEDQIATFVERILLSTKAEGVEPDPDRVNLLTLHSTKGLEFSRVYIVGVEDGELPGLNKKGELKTQEMEEARRLLYVGMTRAKDRLVMTRVATRAGSATLGHKFLDEMGVTPRAPA
ncbi:MAG TPA: UvrD-helicase domain-containing protein [Gemmatimonadaceae bacterium]|nr:UvrD-helicase domain-containing protein [Gemmatimonadaceae bacterium]